MRKKVARFIVKIIVIFRKPKASKARFLKMNIPVLKESIDKVNKEEN